MKHVHSFTISTASPTSTNVIRGENRINKYDGILLHIYQYTKYGSNLGPFDYRTYALPVELSGHHKMQDIEISNESVIMHHCQLLSATDWQSSKW